MRKEISIIQSLKGKDIVTVTIVDMFVNEKANIQKVTNRCTVEVPLSFIAEFIKCNLF